MSCQSWSDKPCLGQTSCPLTASHSWLVSCMLLIILVDHCAVIASRRMTGQSCFAVRHVTIKSSERTQENILACQTTFSFLTYGPSNLARCMANCEKVKSELFTLPYYMYRIHVCVLKKPPIKNEKKTRTMIVL